MTSNAKLENETPSFELVRISNDVLKGMIKSKFLEK